VSGVQRFLCGLCSNQFTLKCDVAGGKTNSGVEPSRLPQIKFYCRHAVLKVVCRCAMLWRRIWLMQVKRKYLEWGVGGGRRQLNAQAESPLTSVLVICSVYPLLSDFSVWEVEWIRFVELCNGFIWMPYHVCNGVDRQCDDIEVGPTVWCVFCSAYCE
jgi:hypothetical protein